MLPGSLGRAKIRPSLLYAREPRVGKRQRKQIPHAEDEGNEFQAYSALLDGAIHFVRLRGSAMPFSLVVPGPNTAQPGVNAHGPHVGVSAGGGNACGTVR